MENKILKELENNSQSIDNLSDNFDTKKDTMIHIINYLEKEGKVDYIEKTGEIKWYKI